MNKLTSGKGSGFGLKVNFLMVREVDNFHDQGQGYEMKGIYHQGEDGV